MLRFFRQIRQRLLAENRFSKYLLYAVGEILLVVIGILIALQVNNWNEERKEAIQEERFLEGLHNEFLKNQQKGLEPIVIASAAWQSISGLPRRANSSSQGRNFNDERHRERSVVIHYRKHRFTMQRAHCL